MMKRLLLLIIVLSAFGLSRAEDVLQVRPTIVAAGLTDDDEVCLEVAMRNSSFDVANLQFDILLPEGMEISYWDYGERIPFTKKGKRIEYDFDAQYNMLSSGYTRFVFIPGGEMRPIEDNDETLIYLYITTSTDMAPGVYPVYVTNIHFDKSIKETIKVNDVSSYVVIGETSPLQTEMDVDLGFLTGYVPSFVVEALSEELSANPNLALVDLSGAGQLGTTLSLNENQLWYTSNEASLNREFPANQWCTVCLPFALSKDMVSELKTNGLEVEKLSEYDVSANEVYFSAVDEMEANMPYAIRCATAMTPFKELPGISVDGIPAPQSIELGRVSMQGTYKSMVLNSDDVATHYAFNAANGEFVRIGKNATVAPFRAYLTLSGVTSAKSIKVVYDGGHSTGIININNANSVVLESSGFPSFDLQGRQLNEQYMKGIYIYKGRKIVRP